MEVRNNPIMDQIEMIQNKLDCLTCENEEQYDRLANKKMVLLQRLKKQVSSSVYDEFVMGL